MGGAPLFKLLRMLTPVVFFLTQSPLAYSGTGGAISPLQVIAVFLKEELKGQHASDGLMTVTRAFLFPGNLMRLALVSAPLNTSPGAPEIDVMDVWDHGIELATQRTAAYNSAKHYEILRAGSVCCIVGSLLSLVLFRVHLLLLFGLAMLGAFFGLNGLTPTIQYALCLSLPILELTRSNSDAAAKEEAAKPANEEAAKPPQAEVAAKKRK